MLLFVWLFLGGEASEDTAQEDFQYKLKGFIDSTVDKRLKSYFFFLFFFIWVRTGDPGILHGTQNNLDQFYFIKWLPTIVGSYLFFFSTFLSPFSAKTRQGALDGLKTAMATRILYEFISERRMTITDSIERCLKKGIAPFLHQSLFVIGRWTGSWRLLLLPGKGEEQRAAASLACLLCIQLGSGIESEEVFKTLKPIFKNILADGSANIQARQAVSLHLPSCLNIWNLRNSTKIGMFPFLTGGNKFGALYACCRGWLLGEQPNHFWFIFKVKYTPKF